MKEFSLKTAQKGFAAGEIFDVGRAEDHAKAGKPARSHTPQAEAERFQEALGLLDRQLSKAASKAAGESASIFDAERMLLNDPMFAGKVRKLIEEDGLDAISAVDRTGQSVAQELSQSESLYIRQRQEDVKGMTQRLLSLLRGEQSPLMTAPALLLAEELSPAQLSSADPSLILGILTLKGSPASHVSILAGNLGVPYAYGSREAIEAARQSKRVILEDGNLITDPEEDLYQQALQRMEKEKKSRQDTPGPDTDSTARTRVYANIGGPQEIEALTLSGAEGVGLFRSEFLFLDHACPPSEEEQYEAYSSVAKAMCGKETVIRTMDLGSDKRASWMALPQEKNPALGCRGLRFSLKEQALFKTQLRALLRAAASGNLRIMLPMVTSVWEVEAARACLMSCAEALSKEGIPYQVPPLGIMIETPAAVLIAEQLAQKADFFSIGTNDLTQYTLALDREAEGLEEYYDPFHEALLRMIEMTAKAGHKYGIPVSVCGELAGNPQAVKRLIASGIDKLSVSLSKIQSTKKLVLEAEEQLLQDQECPISAPADGELIPMEEIPDPVFSSGTMGTCIGIMPESGRIWAPCDGIVSDIAQTGHAITFTASDGRKLLVHVGIDTVTLGGKGFTVLIKEGASVSKGDPVLEADLAVIRSAGLSPMVITALIPG